MQWCACVQAEQCDQRKIEPPCEIVKLQALNAATL